ncbi:MAG: Mg2+ and Co2+ transporter [Rickettsiaceae bacterium]|jgi:magnesium transporter|nr:Mg2+ and Co2+ transporter [Rickettsiaceae bacterium]
MILAYFVQNNVLNKTNLALNQSLPENTIWIDLFNPSREEEHFIEASLDVAVPNPEEISEIQVSNCFYQENNAYYLTARMITPLLDQEISNEGVTFILKDKLLVTVRYFEPQSFKYISSQISKFSLDKLYSEKLLISLLEFGIYYVADVLEKIGKNIDDQTRLIFRSKNKLNQPQEKQDFQLLLSRTGINGDVASKARESLLSLNRLLNYIHVNDVIISNPNHKGYITTLIQDVMALNDHAFFLSSKINFLLDATLGMINIEQNNIIKIFSVAAVVFLPPTLIASIYGMNFDFMPELNWKIGYPIAIGLMLISAWLPFKFFKKKGWF